MNIDKCAVVLAVVAMVGTVTLAIHLFNRPKLPEAPSHIMKNNVITGVGGNSFITTRKELAADKSRLPEGWWIEYNSSADKYRYCVGGDQPFPVPGSCIGSYISEDDAVDAANYIHSYYTMMIKESDGPWVKIP